MGAGILIETAGHQAGERRAHARRVPRPDEPLSRVRVRMGWDFVVLDICDRGVFVEGTARLLPGTRVDLHVVSRHGRTLVRSRVLRAHVHHVTRDEVRYRGAIVFEQSIDTSPHGYPVPADSDGPSPAAGIRYPTTPEAADDSVG